MAGIVNGEPEAAETQAHIATDTPATALNTTHRGSDGSDHSKVGDNETAIGLNTTHRGSDGSDHNFIDQDVSVAAALVFAGVAITGFTTLGSDAPAIKMKEYTSTTGATEGSEITIVHGLTTSKIIGIQALIDDGANILVPPSFTANAGWQYDVWINSTNIHLKLHDTNSEDVLSKSVKIILTYEE